MFLDAASQAALVRSGEVSPDELVEQAISRIEKLTPELTPSSSRSSRRHAPRRKPHPDGRFRGVPYLLKDLASSPKVTSHAQYRKGEGVRLSRQPRLVLCGEDARRWTPPDR
jgi:amidase